MMRDPIGAIELVYDQQEGFMAEPLDLSVGGLNGQIELVASTDEDSLVRFQPSDLFGDTFAIEALEVLIVRKWVYFAIYIETTDPEYAIRPNWVRRSRPQDSNIWMEDATNGLRYNPVSHSLPQLIEDGEPAFGIIAFGPLQQSTDELRFHLDDIKLEAARGRRHSVVFTLREKALRRHCDEALSKPSLVESMREAMVPLRKRVWAMAAYKEPKRGCLGIGASAVFVVLCASWFLLR